MLRKNARKAIDEDEQIARYAYVLGTIPDSVADRAYASAFSRLPPDDRLDIVRQLHAQMPGAEGDVLCESPEAFARLMRSLHARYAFVGVSGAARLAVEFVASPPTVAYFTVGLGSVSIDQHPPWIHDLARHETAPLQAGMLPPREGLNVGGWFA